MDVLMMLLFVIIVALMLIMSLAVAIIDKPVIKGYEAIGLPKEDNASIPASAKSSKICSVNGGAAPRRTSTRFKQKH